MIQVTQEDRILVANYFGEFFPEIGADYPLQIAAGSYDDHPMLQAIAQARHEGRIAALEEAAGVCEQYDGKPCGPAQLWTDEQRSFFDSGQIDATTSCATSIRNLKEPTP